jgi:energy-coupling factor transport system permease protein
VTARSIRRLLHPLAWWVWAGMLGALALRTTNVLLLALLAGVVIYVVGARRSDAPWAKSFGSFIRLGVAVIVIRLLFQVLFGNRIPGTTLFTLPSVELPPWAAGVSVGGPVTVEGLVLAFQQGLRLAVLILCFGAATSLTSPYRLLRTLPAALYEAGVALTVALSFAPQALLSARRIRDAHRLRGRSTRGIRSWAALALPVLEGALDRSVALAASMDSRGYGRRVTVSPAVRRATTVLTLVGMMALAVGAYALLDGSAPDVLGMPVLAGGSLALAGALFAGGRRTQRTRYRPDPWRRPEWLTVLSGTTAMVMVVVADRMGADLRPSVYPLDAPTVPWLAALGVLVAGTPAFVTPRPPGLEASTSSRPVVAPASLALTARTGATT